MQITGTSSIVGTLTLEMRDAFSRAYRSVSITHGQTLEISDKFRFDPAITGAVDQGFITISLEPDDFAAQVDLMGGGVSGFSGYSGLMGLSGFSGAAGGGGGGGTDPDSVQTQNILATGFALSHNNNKILSITSDGGSYTSDSIDAGSAVGQRLLIVILPAANADITISVNTTRASLSGNWIRNNGFNVYSWLALEWNGTTWNEIDRDHSVLSFATGRWSRADGRNTTANGNFSFAIGEQTFAENDDTFASGNNSTAVGSAAVASGINTTATGDASLAEGDTTNAGPVPDVFTYDGTTITISGNVTNKYGNGQLLYFYGLTGGTNNKLFIFQTNIATPPVFSAGSTTFTLTGSLDDRTGGSVSNSAFGRATHAEGIQSVALGRAAHAEGNSSKALGDGSHAEGVSSSAVGPNTHAEGGSIAFGDNSHAESGSQSVGIGSHAEGASVSVGDSSHSENQGITSGTSSHAEGIAFTGYAPLACTIAGGTAVTISGFDATAQIPENSTVSIYNLSGGDPNIDPVAVRATATGVAFGTDTTFTINLSTGGQTSGQVVCNNLFAIYAHAEGNGCQALGNSSHAQGIQSFARLAGQHAFSTGQFAAIGDAQSSEFMVRTTTSDNSATPLTVDGGALQLSLNNNTTYGYSAKVIARQTGGTSACAFFELSGFITRGIGAGTTRLVSGSTTVVADATASTWTVVPSADTGSGALVFTVTGQNSKNIQWVAHVRTIETFE